MEEENRNSQVELTEVATQMTTAYKLPDGETVSADGLLLWMANEIYEIRKAVA